MRNERWPGYPQPSLVATSPNLTSHCKPLNRSCEIEYSSGFITMLEFGQTFESLKKVPPPYHMVPIFPRTTAWPLLLEFKLNTESTFQNRRERGVAQLLTTLPLTSITRDRPWSPHTPCMCEFYLLARTNLTPHMCGFSLIACVGKSLILRCAKSIEQF